MKKINLLYIAWAAVLAFLYWQRDWFQAQSGDYFFGIAETEGRIVNLEYPAEVLKLHVRPGQEVKEGSLLLEVSRSSLEYSYLEKKSQLEQARLNYRLYRQSLEADIRQLEYEKEIVSTRIRNEIRELQAGEQLQQGLREIVLEGKDIVSDTLWDSRKTRIQGLEQQLALEVQPLQERIGYLKGLLENGKRPESLEAGWLEKELALLEEEEKELRIYAATNGIVSLIHFQPGEVAPAYSELMRIYPRKASYVKGYLHESASTLLVPGDTLSVSSLTGQYRQTMGVVTGIGPDIMEFPVRIRKYPEIKVWGREVFVSLPDTTDFWIREKVLIEQIAPEELPGR